MPGGAGREILAGSGAAGATGEFPPSGAAGGKTPALKVKVVRVFEFRPKQIREDPVKIQNTLAFQENS